MFDNILSISSLELDDLPMLKTVKKTINALIKIRRLKVVPGNCAINLELV